MIPNLFSDGCPASPPPERNFVVGQTFCRFDPPNHQQSLSNSEHSSGHCSICGPASKPRTAMVAKEETEEDVVLSTCPTTNCHLTGVLPLASNSQEGADAKTRNPRHCPSTGEDLFLPSHGPEFEKHRSFSDSIRILAVSIREVRRNFLCSYHPFSLCVKCFRNSIVLVHRKSQGEVPDLQHTWNKNVLLFDMTKVI